MDGVFIPAMGLSFKDANSIHESSIHPPPRAHLLTSSDLRFQHINIDSDYSHDPGTLSTADTLTGSPWFRWSSEFSGIGECLRLSLNALFSRFLAFFSSVNLIKYGRVN